MMIRLNKFLSEAGICSRREADRLIEEQRVTVDGELAITGMRITANQEIRLDDNLVRRQNRKVLLAFHKPVGVVCTTDKRWGDTTAEEIVNYPTRVFCVGRLDKESEGLLLMTNDGDMVNRIMRAGNYHEKEYEVMIDREVTNTFLKKLGAGGIPILEQQSRPCKVWKTGKRSFSIILTQGLNRQIRRMCQYLGCKVVRLKRVRIMNIHLDNLKVGTVREITGIEFETLMVLLKDSKSNPR